MKKLKTEVQRRLYCSVKVTPIVRFNRELKLINKECSLLNFVTLQIPRNGRGEDTKKSAEGTNSGRNQPTQRPNSVRKDTK